jgi:putative transposase
VIKAFKVRIYPTKEQEASLWKHINCGRYVWNYMLALQQARYTNGEQHLSRFDLIKLLTLLKKDGEHDWLCDVSSITLQIACSDLSAAYNRMFNRAAKKPRFKSKKKAKAAFGICSQNFYFKNESQVKVEKIGYVKYKTDFNFPIGRGFKFSNPRISYKNGKWMLSFGMKCENQAPVLTDKKVGIDLGIKELAVVAIDDEQLVFHNINKSKKMRTLNKQLERIQRAISRKYQANKVGNRFVKTRNIEKLEDKLRKLHARISDIRENYIHQTTHKIVSMLPSRVTMEDLNVSGMVKNRHLSKAISEQCFYEFIRQMRYKCAWNGIEFIQANRFYPSSKTCSHCGRIKQDLKLSDRTFVCNDCGFTIDRDYNAAINLMRYEA